jgi:hypothetical protein
MLSTSASCFYLSENHLTQEKVDVHLVDGLMDGMNVHVSPAPKCFNHFQRVFCMLGKGVIPTVWSIS